MLTVGRMDALALWKPRVRVLKSIRDDDLVTAITTLCVLIRERWIRRVRTRGDADGQVAPGKTARATAPGWPAPKSLDGFRASPRRRWFIVGVRYDDRHLVRGLYARSSSRGHVVCAGVAK